MLHALTLSLAMSSTAWCGGGGGCCLVSRPLVQPVENRIASEVLSTTFRAIDNNSSTLLFMGAQLALPPNAFPATLPIWWKKP